MTWFGGFQCYSCSWPCGLTCEAWGWGRSSQSCYESWWETTVDCAWSKKKKEEEVGNERWKERELNRGVKKCEWGKTGEKRDDTKSLVCMFEIYESSTSVGSATASCFLLFFYWLSNNCCIGSLRVLTAVLEKLWRSLEGRVCMSMCVLSDGL